MPLRQPSPSLGGKIFWTTLQKNEQFSVQRHRTGHAGWWGEPFRVIHLSSHFILATSHSEVLIKEDFTRVVGLFTKKFGKSPGRLDWEEVVIYFNELYDIAMLYVDASVVKEDSSSPKAKRALSDLKDLAILKKDTSASPTIASISAPAGADGAAWNGKYIVMMPGGNDTVGSHIDDGAWAQMVLQMLIDGTLTNDAFDRQVAPHVEATLADPLHPLGHLCWQLGVSYEEAYGAAGADAKKNVAIALIETLMEDPSSTPLPQIGKDNDFPETTLPLVDMTALDKSTLDRAAAHSHPLDALVAEQVGSPPRPVAARLIGEKARATFYADETGAETTILLKAKHTLSAYVDAVAMSLASTFEPLDLAQPALLPQISAVAEACMLERVGPVLLSLYKAKHKREDGLVVEACVSLKVLNACDFGVTSDCAGPVEAQVTALTEILVRMTASRGVSAKLAEVLMLCREAVRIGQSTGKVVGGDDLLPIIAFAVVTAEVEDLHSQCQYMQDFISNSAICGERGYALATLMAANLSVQQRGQEIAGGS